MNLTLNVQPQWKQRREDSQILRQIYIFQENCRSQLKSSFPLSLIMIMVNIIDTVNFLIFPVMIHKIIVLEHSKTVSPAMCRISFPSLRLNFLCGLLQPKLSFQCSSLYIFRREHLSSCYFGVFRLLFSFVLFFQ